MTASLTTRRNVSGRKAGVSTKKPKLKSKILLDFMPAQDSMGGIGEDTRLMLQCLQTSESVQHIDLLLYPKLLGNGAFKISDKSGPEEWAAALQGSLGLYTPLTSGYFPRIEKLLEPIERLYHCALELCRFFHSTGKIDHQFFAGRLYRALFPSKEPAIGKAFRKVGVIIGNFSWQRMRIVGRLPRWLPLPGRTFRLNTVDYDFFITQWWNSFEIDAGTKLIIRFHDMISFIDTDLATCRQTYFLQQVKNNAPKGFFFCDSEPSRSKLLQLLPQIGDRAFVVPCAISETYKRTENFARFQSICQMHWSAAGLIGYSADQMPIIRNRVCEEISRVKSLKYILFISNFRPHKNLYSLIKAWHTLYVTHGIRLVLCGNDQWHTTFFTEPMAALIESGAIIHLKKVPHQDMPVLYSHAQALVSPSYAEGFGMPAVEAMTCGCPLILSDIDEYRWVIGDAALYFDPYDVNNIEATISKLLFDKNSAALRRKLVALGTKRAERYTVKSVSKVWETVLSEIARIQ